jgi:Pentapeptide repeats (8 copies)
MPRGRFWEATFDPNWEGPTVNASFTDLDGSSELVERVVKSPNPVTVKWTLTAPTRLFQKCDIAENVRDSFISNCTFSECRFQGSSWTNVKFSNCRFVLCDFSRAIFSRCYFVSNCRFERISASAELFRIEETAISATAFISGLETNLVHTDQVEYQKHRFIGTRQKIAKSIFSATRNEADVNFYFEAYEQLTRCTLDEQVEQHRFDGAAPVSSRRFWFRSAPARLERRIVLTSGWLTRWGRSLLWAFAFFLVTVSVFSGAYALITPVPAVMASDLIWQSAVQALNITLVAGYTAHFNPEAPRLHQGMCLANVLLGIYWYSLVVPVLSRRILR